MRRCTKSTILCEFVNEKVSFFSAKVIVASVFAAFGVVFYDGNDSLAMPN